MKIVRGIRSGRIVPRKPGTRAVEQKPDFYALWSDADMAAAPHPMHMPAPKMTLPGHAESYNPPAEYLWTEDEKREHDEKEDEDKKGMVVPAKYGALRHVPAYSDFVQERFERCLDLYLAPRALRRRPRLDIKDASELIPKLPSPRELRPFPHTCAVTYAHPLGVRTRSVDLDPTGMWVLTGADDGVVRLWETTVGRCAATWALGREPGASAMTPVTSVAWCTNRERPLFAAAVGGKVHVVSPVRVLSTEKAELASTYALAAFNTKTTEEGSSSSIADVRWNKTKDGDDSGRLLEIEVPGTLREIVWHRRGDYFATIATDGTSTAISLTPAADR